MTVNAFLSWRSDMITVLFKYYFTWPVMFAVAVESDMLSHTVLTDELQSLWKQKLRAEIQAHIHEDGVSKKRKLVESNHGRRDE